MNKTRNFIVKIYEKPFTYKLKAKNKKEAEQEAIKNYQLGIKSEQHQNIHKIKVINDTDLEFYSTPLTDIQQKEEL